MRNRLTKSPSKIYSNVLLVGEEDNLYP